MNPIVSRKVSRPKLLLLLALSMLSACLNSPETFRPDVGFVENVPPVATDDSFTVMINRTTVLDLVGNDSDADGDQLVILSFTQPASGSLVLGDSNTLVYTSGDVAASVQFEYRIGDGQGGEASASVSIEVIAQNDLPIALADTSTTQQNEAVTIMVLANDSDPDGDPLSVISADQSENASIEIDGNSLRYIPNAAFYGRDDFAYTISDGRGLQATAYVSVAVNGRPVLVDDVFAVAITGPTHLNVLENDHDPDGNDLTIRSVIQPTAGEVRIEVGQLAYTPPSGFRGHQRFRYTVEDLHGGVATATVTVRVSSPPVTGADAVLTQEDEAILISVLDNDSDPESDVLAISGVTPPSNGTARVTSTGTISYTPNTGFSGLDQFYYTITDGNLNVATGTVSVTVNARPVLAADLVYTAVDAAIAVDVLANDSDPDGDALSVTAIETPPAGTATITVQNWVRYTPPIGFRGAVRFSYTVLDARGGRAIAQIEVVVNSVPIAVAESAFTQEDATVIIDVLANDSDPDNNRLFVSGAQPGANGVVNINADNTISYTPISGFWGLDQFVYTVDDGRTGTASATVTVTVNGRPAANPESYTTQQATPIVLDVLANDSDPDQDAFQIESVLPVFTGTVSNDLNLTLTYSPNSTFFGVETITYSIIDARGGRDSAVVTVTVNGQTTAVPDSGLTQVDTAIVIDVLANDVDPEGDILTVSSFTQPLNGTVITDGGALRYTPNGGFNGNDVFNYTITDGGSTSTAQVTVRVNAPPIANPDAEIVQLDTVTLIDVLANDTDPDNDPLLILAADLGTPNNGGTVSSTAGDIIRYTPASGFSGTETFTYRISDSSGGFASQTVTITINQSPVAVDDTDLAQAETPLTITVLDNDADPDGDALTITTVTQGQNGSVSIAATGTELVYTSDVGFFGPETFSYSISDGRGGSATATVNLNVNAPPIVVNDVFNVLQDTVTLLDVLANDDSPDQDALTLVSVVGVNNGSIVLANNALELEYTPNAGFVGAESFNYTMRDDNGGSATGTVTLTVVRRADLSVRTEGLTGIADTESIAVADFDGDNLPDVVASNRRANTVTIVRGLGPGFGDRIEFAVAGTPVDVAVGDINGDGSSDIVTANLDAGTISVLLNTSIGPNQFSFAPPVNFNCRATPNSVFVADLNQDNLLDVVVANGAANTVSVLLNTTPNSAAIATFSAAVSLVANNARDVFAADINRDNALDIVTLDPVLGLANAFINLTTGTVGQAVSFSGSTAFVVGNNPSALVMPDLNEDGCPDLVVANTGSDNLSVRLNSTPLLGATPSFRADAPIALAASASPLGLTSADLNNDTRPDLMVTNSGNNSFSAILNTTTAQTTTVSFGAVATWNTNVAPLGVAPIFIDADQLPDLVIMNSGTDLLTSYLNQTQIVSATPLYAESDSVRMGRSSPVDVEVADLTRDTNLDVITLDRVDRTISVFANDSTAGASGVSVAARATFEFSASQASDLVLGDLNGDDLIDALVVDSSVSTLFWRLNSTVASGLTVTFEAEATLTTNANPVAAAISDLDGDGINDLVIVEQGTDQIAIYRNQSAVGATTLSFAVAQNFATGLNPTAIAIADLNADNRPDIVVTNGNQNSVTVLVNQTTIAGTLVFQAVGPFSVSAAPTALVIADFDSDGTVDIVSSNQNDDSIAVLRGTTVAGSAAVTFADAQIFNIVPTASVITKLSSADINGDGRFDLVAATSSDDTVSVFYNLTVTSATTLAFTRSAYTLGTNPSAATTADLNADGNIELVTSNFESDDLVILSVP